MSKQVKGCFSVVAALYYTTTNGGSDVVELDLNAYDYAISDNDWHNGELGVLFSTSQHYTLSRFIHHLGHFFLIFGWRLP